MIQSFPFRLKGVLMIRYLVLIALPLLLAADWPQWMGPTRDGVISEKEMLPAWAKEGPKTRWNFDVGSGWSSPIVVGNRVYLHHRVDDAEILSGLDIQSGKEVLRVQKKTRYLDDFNFDDGPRATPCVHGSVIFTLGADGDLSAHQFADGKEVWSRNINRDYKVQKGFFGVASSPIIIEDLLLINVGGKGAAVVAFDPATGKEVWKAGENDGVSYSSPVLAKIDNELLAVFFTRQGLLAVTPTKGEVRYQFEWRPRINSSVNAANPVVSGNRIFLSTSYSRGAILLEAAKGELKEIWSGDEALSCHFNTPILSDSFLYGIDGRQEGGGKLRCVEFGTGDVRWTEKGFGCASLLKAQQRIVALTENGELVLFEANPKAFHELARAKILDSPLRASMAYADGKLFARDGKKLICVELK